MTPPCLHPPSPPLTDAPCPIHADFSVFYDAVSQLTDAATRGDVGAEGTLLLSRSAAGSVDGESPTVVPTGEMLRNMVSADRVHVAGPYGSGNGSDGYGSEEATAGSVSGLRAGQMQMHWHLQKILRKFLTKILI
jgi:hypothetical protein